MVSHRGERNEPAYLPELAMSLWAGAWVRNAQNVEIDAALTAVDEAIAIYTKLAEDLPGYFERYLQAAQQTREDLTRRRQWPGRTPRTPG